jgi:chromosome partitioning protein
MNARFDVWANKKGGVGKSTLAVHYAVWLFDQGFKTALLDADEQRSSSRWLAQAEPKIEIRVANSPEECVPIARELKRGHDFIVGDAPGGMGEISRTMLLLADLALFPIGPSILDVWSVKEATETLRFAQGINEGRPEGQLVLNKMETRGVISRELKQDAHKLGLTVATTVIRQLRVYRDTAQQGTVVTRIKDDAPLAAAELESLFGEILGKRKTKRVGNG